MRLFLSLLVLLALCGAARAQTGCVPNPNANPVSHGVVNFVNCPILPSGLNKAFAAGGASVSTNTELTNTRFPPGTVVVRDGFAAAGDGGRAVYVINSGACSHADNGAQVSLANGGCAIADFSGVMIEPQVWGAKGDGTTDDTPAINSALWACGLAGGGVVHLPATGHAYRLASGLGFFPSTCSIQGEGGGPVLAGVDDNVENHWTNSGTWIRCEDTVHPCITMNGHGQGLSNLNFWYTQPTPPNAHCGSPCVYTHGWTPTIYPYTITAESFYTDIRNISVINGTHCIDLEGPSSGVAGAFVRIHDVMLGCSVNALKTRRIDNTLYLSDIRIWSWWFNESSDKLGYEQGDQNRVDWILQYVANAQVNGIEFWRSGIAMYFVDDTVTSGFGSVTFAAGDLQMTNVSFNETCQAMRVENGTTHLSGNNHLVNIIAAPDSGTSSGSPAQCAGAYPLGFFDLASDNVNLTLMNISGGLMQTFLYAGNGGGTSKVHLAGNLAIESYSFWAGAAPAIIANNAQVQIDGGLDRIVANSGAGQKLFGLTFTKTVVPGGVQIENLAQQERAVTFATEPADGSASQLRWAMAPDDVAESGGNVGASLTFRRYADDGSLLDAPVSVSRATGDVALVHGLVVGAHLRPATLTIGTLPGCASGNKYDVYAVTDLFSAPTYRQVGLSGGGTVPGLVMCNGTNWEAH